MFVRIIGIISFLIINYLSYSQNLIKNPCFLPSINENKKYTLKISDDSILQINTKKCVYFYPSEDKYILDTSNYLINDWTEFSSYKNYSFNITKFDSGWFLCRNYYEKYNDTCYVINFSPYGVWFNEKIFLGGTLSDTLICGRRYKFSFKIMKINDNPFSLKEISILFSKTNDTINFLLQKKQSVPTKADIVFTLNNDSNWQLMEKYFIAKGYEKFLFIGIMNEEINKISLNKISWTELYYRYFSKKKINNKSKKLLINKTDEIYKNIFYVDYNNIEKIEKNFGYIFYLIKDIMIIEEKE